MSGILFRPSVPTAPRSPNRADIALFVGTVRRRANATVDPVSPRARAADPLYRWLEAAGWTLAANRRDRLPLEELLDVPVPIERWSDFDRLFDWESRSFGEDVTGATYLGIAVRSFFAEGGRRCYVVRVADPFDFEAKRASRDGLLQLLVPRSGKLPAGSAVDRSTWRGVWHVFGLPDVSFLSVPDLPDAVADPAPEPLPPEPAPVASEEFVECTMPAPEGPRFRARSFSAPRCDEAGYVRWAGVLGTILDALTHASSTTTLREVQLVAAVPLPERRAPQTAAPTPSAPGAAAPDVDLLAFLKQSLKLDDERALLGIASAFLQLAYPWVQTAESALLPDALANPEAVLVGMLASQALLRGTYRSAAGLPSQSILELEPRLRAQDTTSRSEVRRRLANNSDALSTVVLDDAEQLSGAEDGEPAGPELVIPVENLVRRVSLFGRTASGFSLLSDVTTARDASYRQAHVGRLVAAIVRAARQLGHEDVFEPSSPEVWEALRGRLVSLLSGLWRAGALRGASEREAYFVRCDRSTMSDDDIDQGRVIAEVGFDAAAAIDRITVSLSLNDDRSLANARAQ